MFNEADLTADQQRMLQRRLDATTTAIGRGDRDAALRHLNDIFQVHPELNLVFGEALAGE